MTSTNIPRRLSGVDADGKLIKQNQSDLLGRSEPIVVLGDAGMGKTTLLENIGQELGYKFVHARRLVRSLDPSKLLGDATAFVIDALDELAVQAEGDAVDAVLGSLEKAGFPNFILSCRVADWRSATSTQAVADTYGNDPLELFLEPISRDEARILLSNDVGDKSAENVISHFENIGLEGLFGNPQTLKLIRAVASERELPNSRAALFDLSTKKMWAEHSKTKATSSLSQLGETEALNAAGCLFSSLILTGKRAVSRLSALSTDEDDLPIAEISIATSKDDLLAVLSSRLLTSNVEGDPDRFTYTHRSVGEFLAARWLAQTADTDRKRRRLLKLFHGHGLVPASLRGIHAWLAQDTRLASHVITADPMGLVEYGDTNCLSDEQARTLLQSLLELGDRDPRFYDFDKTHSLHGIAKPSLCHELKELIISPSTPFSLRAMLLHALSGSAVATRLAETFKELALDPDVTFYERRIAGNALVDLPIANVDWARIFSNLHDLADENSLRLAIELLPGMGFLGTTNKQIVELILAFCGLSICEFPRKEQHRIGGVLWGLEKKLPDERIEPVLNILSEYLKALLGDNFDRLNDSDIIDVVYVLTERRLALGSVDPLRLWRWLSSTGERRGFRKEAQKTISEWLHNNDEVRQRIQRFVLLEQAGTKTVWMRGWRLNDLLHGLYPDESDIIKLLSFLDPLTDASGDRWKDLVRLCPHDQEQGASVRKAAAPFATETENREFLRNLSNPEIPEWLIQRDERDCKLKEEKEASWAEHRAGFLEHIDDLRSGKFEEVVSPAQAYLNLYTDMGNDLPAHARVKQWLGLELQEAAFLGFEAYLSDANSKPTAKEIADAYAERKRWHGGYIFVAAAAERIRNQKNLDDLSDERLLALLLEIRLTHILDHAGIDQVSEAIELAVKSRPGLWEKFWRLRIEPQLEAKNEHVDGLYEVARSMGDSDLAVSLAIEWLERFPKMSHRAEVELIDCLIAADEFETLRKHASSQKVINVSEKERRSDWDAVALLVDFENMYQKIEEAHGNDKDFLWHLRSRLGRHHDEGLALQLAPVQLAWIIRNFRRMWPHVYHPRGGTTGDTNTWDAAKYLQTLINRLGGLTSSEAVSELSRLRDEPTDGYTDQLKRTFAEQAQRVVENNYKPPTICELESALRDVPPSSMNQLQAVMLEELAVIQGKIRSHPVDWYRDFFSKGIPKDEEECRDMLLKMFGDYPYGISCEPEGHLADDKRADIRCTIDQLMLPIEIKGQWHKDLWIAADKQLDMLYSNDWRAERKGIYLVFWFGENVPKNKKLKSPGKGRKLPTTADELRLELIENSLVAKQGGIEIIVLDLVRP